MKSVVGMFTFFLSVAFAVEPSMGLENFFIHSPSMRLTQLARQTGDAGQDQPVVLLPGPTSAVVKSRGKAFLLSLAIPGMGERYAERYGRGNRFIATEVFLWLSYAGFVTYRSWRQEDYKNYAAAHAGVNLEGKSESYFIDVGNYRSIYTYNAAKLRQRNLPKYYRDMAKYYWQWEDEASRAEFDQLRISADMAHSRSLFVIGAIFANHVVSAVDAVIMAHKHNRKSSTAWNWDVRFGDGMSEPMVTMTVRGEF